MEVKKIVEGMTAPQVAQVIDDNFKNQNKILEEDIAKQNSVIGVSEYKDFSEAEAVNVGDVRKYNGFLYECVEATTGAFDASKWKKSSFKAETEKKLSELGSKVDAIGLSGIYKDFTNTFLQLNDYNIGDVLPNPTEFGGVRNYTIDCKEGDSFYIRYYSGSNSSKYGFVDENNRLVEKGETNKGLRDAIITAPKNTNKLMVFLTSDSYGKQLVCKVDYVIEHLNNAINGVSFGESYAPTNGTLGYIDLRSYKVGDTLPQIGTSLGTRYLTIDCKEGDHFLYKSYAGAEWPHWVIIDNNRNIVSIDELSGLWKNGIIKVPTNSDSLIIMFADPYNIKNQYLYKFNQSGSIIADYLLDIDKNIDSIVENINNIAENINNVVENGKEVQKYNLTKDKYTVEQSYANYNITHQYITEYLEVKDNSSTDLTGYIPCDSGDVFRYLGKGVGYAVVGYTDNEGGGIVGLLVADVSGEEKIITIPDGINYIRAWSRNEDHPSTPFKLVIDKMNVVKGNAKEYIEDVIKEVLSEEYQQEEEFSVDVNGRNPYRYNDFNAVVPDNNVEDKIYSHRCYLKMPKQLTEGKCKLVISCPGGGIKSKDWYHYKNHGAILNALGYAVLCITGYSNEWAVENSVSGAVPCGSWMATEEVLKAYHYVISKYSMIDKDGCYLYGESQGGMVAENVAEETNIPILATVLDAPAISMQYAQMYLSSRATSVKALYGMENHQFDKYKCVGCDPFTRNMSEDIVMNENGTLPTIDVLSITARKFRALSSPLLILSGEADNMISTKVHQAYAKSLINASFPIELIVYSGIGHGVVEYTQPITAIGGHNCTRGLMDMLLFLERNGGYSVM